MVGTMTSFHDQIHVDEPSALARTMFVDTYGVRATDFDIDEKVQDLLSQRRWSRPAFLDTWTSTATSPSSRRAGSSTSPTSWRVPPRRSGVTASSSGVKPSPR